MTVLYTVCIGGRERGKAGPTTAASATSPAAAGIADAVSGFACNSSRKSTCAAAGAAVSVSASASSGYDDSIG
jgi:hypothetical protein